MDTPEFQAQLQKAIDHLREVFSSLQVGRATPALVENVKVDAYGSPMDLKATANVSCPDNQTLRVEPWDKTLVGAIEKAIQTSGAGFNPQNMGEYLIIPIPPLTEERRKEMVKKVHQEAENARVSIRNVRHAVMNDLKKEKDNKEISEDEFSAEEKKVQTKVDEANKQIDEMAGRKEGEVMGQ